MPRCCVDIMRKVLATEAPDEKSTIAKAAETSKIPPERQNRIVVTKLDTSAR